MPDFFSDSLDDLLSGPVASQPRQSSNPTFVPDAKFIEGCKACGGTGTFRSWSGRAVGPCFKCKGAGKLAFKSSAADRAKTRDQAADRKAARAQSDVDAFAQANPEVFAWINESAATFSFAASMLEAIRKFGDLTPNQLAACQRCVDKRAASKVAREASAVTVDVSKIEQAFATAKSKADRPGALGVWLKPLKLQSGDFSVQFSLGSVGSKWEGQVFAKTTDGKKLGSIKDGKFTKRFECSDAEAAAVVDCAQDPHKAAVAFGKAWSVCSVCSRSLTNDGSIERGIGPICAEKFGW